MATPMNNRNEQNGRPPPPLPGQPLTSLETLESDVNQDSTEKKEICRNFVWGSCNKNTQCKFRHELDFEEMKKILKFCHDYQNSPGCTREHCAYLHTSKEEETLFFRTGQLPRVLAERHANMTAAAAETIPQIALFIQESFLGPPPPPPPPPAPVVAPPPAAPTSIPMQRASARILPLQQLPPPPPPPTVPTTSVQHAPIFTAPTASAVPVFPLNQPPPPILPIFDATKPPPPIPTQMQTKNTPVKRKSPTTFDVQSKKVKKMEDGRDGGVYCDQCVQRDIRIETYRHEMDTLSSEEEYQTLLYKKKFEEYQNRKDLLRSLVSKELYRLIEEYVEGVPQLQVQDMFSQLNQTSFVSGTSSVPKQFLIQILEYVLENSRIDVLSSSTSRMEDNLTAFLKKKNFIGSPPEVMQTFMEILKQMTKSSTISTSCNNINLFENRYSNGQELQGIRPAPAISQAPPPSYQTYSAAVPPPGPSTRHYYAPPFAMPAAAAMSVTSRPPPPAPPAPTAPQCLPYATSVYQPQFYQRH